MIPTWSLIFFCVFLYTLLNILLNLRAGSTILKIFTFIQILSGDAVMVGLVLYALDLLP